MNEVKINKQSQSITFINNGIAFSQFGIAKEILDLVDNQQQEIERLKRVKIEKEFYIGQVEVEPICYDTYRDVTGTLVRTRQEEPEIKIELISY